MSDYLQILLDGYQGYARYFWAEVTNPHLENYFYWLIAVSAFFFLLEVATPWRKTQSRFRKDFWLDFFYMFFNFFLFSLIIYNAASDVAVTLFKDFLALFSIRNLVAIQIDSWPAWVQLLTLFLIRDFIHWNVHRMLHRVEFLWKFHQVHHSVEEMGFAAHLRFHWMERVVYASMEYLPLAMIGFGIDDFFAVHIFALAVGHFNHSNFRLRLGPLKYLLNNPQMHIWHHAKRYPEDRPYGMNFGLTLSVWDYLFGTAHTPFDGRDIELGVPGVESFPSSFAKQVIYGFGLTKEERSKRGGRQDSQAE